MRELTRLVVLAVCTGWAGSAFPQSQVLPNPNPIGNHITLSAGSTYVTSGDDVYNGDPSAGSQYNNLGSIDIDGTWDNEWFLWNLPSGTFNINGEFSNNALFTSVGTINNNSGGTLNNTYSDIGGLPLWGVLNISGTLNNNLGATLNNDGDFASAATVNNAGTLISSATGSIYNGVCAAGEEGCGPSMIGGTLNNNTDGTLTFQLGTIFDNTYGTLNNNAGGRIESYVDNFYFNELAVGTVNLDSGSTFANYAVMTSSSVLTNVATIENNGTLASTATGTINNAGTLVSTATGTINNGGTLDNSATLENDGTLTNDLGALLTNSGTLSNSGMLDNIDTLDNTGTLNNSGMLDNIDTLNNGATGNNTGTLNNDSTLDNSGTLFNHATLNNNDGGTLDNSGYLYNNTGGTLTNSVGGTLNNNAGGTLNNYSEINNDGTLNNAGILINNSGGTLKNTGTITSTGIISNAGTMTLIDGVVDATAISNSNTFNLSGGTLTVQSGSTFDNVGFFNFNGGILNVDTLENRGVGTTFNFNGGILNVDTIENTASAHMTLTDGVVDATAIYNSGTFNVSGGTLKVQLGSIFDNNGGTLNGNGGGRIESYVDNFYANVVAVGTVNLGRFSTFANYAVMTSSDVLTSVGTIENNGTLNNNSSGTLNNNGTLDNTDTLNNNGMLDNTGTLNNGATGDNNGTLNNDGTLDNSGTLWNHGTLNNNDGGTLDNSGSFYNNTGGTLINSVGGTLNNKAGSWLNNYSEMNNDGTLNNTGLLSNNSGGTLNNTGTITSTGTIENEFGATMTLTEGVVDASLIYNAGTFNLNGGILNVDTFNGDLNNTGGTVGPGHSPGITTINGDYSQDANSMLLIEILGMTSGTEYDVLNVTGSATLGGVLNIDLDYAGLALGDSFDILIADAILGEFASVSNGRINEHWIWTLDYDLDGSNTVTASVSAVPLPAAAWLFISAIAGLAGAKRLSRSKGSA